MAEEIQVFGAWASPFSRRVELALKLKAVEYQYIEEDLTKKSDLLLKYNPLQKKVPVLVHHGKPIADSLVILEYIEENWKPNYPIFPKDRHERALARFWVKYIDHKVGVASVRAARSGGEEREKAVETVQEALGALEKELKSKRFFGGHKIGLVDIAGIYVACWLPAFEQGLGFQILSTQKFPKLIKWTEELTNHSVVKQILPPKHQLAAYLQTRFGTNNLASKL